MLLHIPAGINDHQQHFNQTMEGISVAASVASLVQITATVIDFFSTMTETSRIAQNVLAELRELEPIFHQLQDFILDFDEGNGNDRKSMIFVDQLVATLTGCVCSFAELEQVLDGLNINDNAGVLLRLWGTAKWALKDPDLVRILDNLQKYKLTLNLMLTIITWFVAAHCLYIYAGLMLTIMYQQINANGTA